LEKAKDKAQEAWDNRDASIDGAEGNNNDALETAKNEAIAAFNDEAVETAITTALGNFNTEEAKIEDMRNTFADNQKLKEEARKDLELSTALNYIYGTDAEGD
jgi:hypothetical protein